MKKTPYYTAQLDDDGDAMSETLTGFDLLFDARKDAERQAKVARQGTRFIILEAKEAIWTAEPEIVDDTTKPDRSGL